MWKYLLYVVLPVLVELPLTTWWSGNKKTCKSTIAPPKETMYFKQHWVWNLYLSHKHTHTYLSHTQSYTDDM